MEIIEVLEKIGLNQKEASIYLALLELGTAAVQSIANKAGLKRPTTYLILDDLQRKGLVSEVPQSKKSLFVAESPDRLVADLGRKQELVKRALPELLARYNQKKEKPLVQLFQGKEGMREMYEKIFSAGEVSFFCTIKDVDKMFPDLPKEVITRAKAGRLKVREMVTQSPEDLAHAQRIAKANYYPIRVVPEGMEFLTDNVLFGNSVGFFVYQPQIFAVLITSRELVQSLRTLYELAWKSAEVPKAI
jgi:HTH-type transcriptional regulator, sugar sensing transcriptional regulator